MTIGIDRIRPGGEMEVRVLGIAMQRGSQIERRRHSVRGIVRMEVVWVGDSLGSKVGSFDVE